MVTALVAVVVVNTRFMVVVDAASLLHIVAVICSQCLVGSRPFAHAVMLLNAVVL